MSKNDDDRGIVTALARGLDILRCFDRPRLELTVSEIARRVGLSQPTTWRLCATLIQRGFLVRSPGGAALRIGAPALTLGYAAINGLDLPAIVAPYMPPIRERTRGSITLSLRRGIEMVSVEQINGDFVMPNQPIGWRASLSATAAGLAVLAVLPEDERAKAVEQLRARSLEAWPRREARIRGALEQYAREGVVVVSGMFDGQYVAAAAPLVEGVAQDSQRFWALSCGALRTSWDAERLAAAAGELRNAAALLQPALATLRPSAS